MGGRKQTWNKRQVSQGKRSLTLSEAEENSGRARKLISCQPFAAPACASNETLVVGFGSQSMRTDCKASNLRLATRLSTNEIAAAAEGLREFEGLTGGITAEQGAHANLGMDERAFSILRIMETASPDTDHATLQGAAKAVGDIYATAQRSQPSWSFMDGYKKELRQRVRRIETYPAVALQMDRLRLLQAEPLGRDEGHLRHGNKPLHDDVRDALACALVA